MRLILSAVLACLLAASLSAQRGGHAGGGFGRGGGIGRGGGGVRAPVFSRGGGFRGGLGSRGGFRFHGFRGPRFYGYYANYGWPLLYSGWNDDYYPAYTPAYSYGYGYQAQPAAPVVVIEQSTPSVIVEQPPPPPPPARATRSNEPALYLIAFNDHNIKPAVAYWTEKNTLRYVTMDHEIKTAPLSSIDRDLSMRLNDERGVPFTLPNG